MKFHKDFLINELDLPYSAIKNTITGQSRWSTQHEIVFAHEGKFYMTNYSEGSTESQDESPFEYSPNEIECIEVELVEKLIKVWQPK